MHKFVVVGQAPSVGTDGQEPLCGRSGARLAALLGMDGPEHLRSEARLLNLLERYPGPAKAGKGDAFPMAAAREAARAILPTLRGERVVALGLGVATALGLHRPALLTTWRWADATVLVLPHPSGVSRFWNDLESVELARLSLVAHCGSTQARSLSLTAIQPAKLHHRQKQST